MNNVKLNLTYFNTIASCFFDREEAVKRTFGNTTIRKVHQHC